MLQEESPPPVSPTAVTKHSHTTPPQQVSAQQQPAGWVLPAQHCWTPPASCQSLYGGQISLLRQRFVDSVSNTYNLDALSASAEKFPIVISTGRKRAPRKRRRWLLITQNVMMLVSLFAIPIM